MTYFRPCLDINLVQFHYVYNNQGYTIDNGSVALLLNIDSIDHIPVIGKLTLAIVEKQLYIIEPPHEKTNALHMRKTKTQISFAVTAKLIGAFVFTTRIVQFLFYL